MFSHSRAILVLAATVLGVCAKPLDLQQNSFWRKEDGARLETPAVRRAEKKTSVAEVTATGRARQDFADDVGSFVRRVGKKVEHAAVRLHGDDHDLCHRGSDDGESLMDNLYNIRDVMSLNDGGTAYLRLAPALARLMAHPKDNFTIIVLGNSVTEGWGNCGATCQNTSTRWSSLLQKFLQQKGFTGVHVVNKALKATSSETILPMLQTNSKLDLAQMFIVDYTVTDSPPCCGMTSYEQVHNATRNMVRFLLSRPSRPAVVYLETFMSTFAALPNSVSGDGFHCEHAPKEFPHYKVLKEFKVPTLNYNAVECPTLKSVATWFPAPHPHTDTHERIAHVVTEGLMHWANGFKHALGDGLYTDPRSRFHDHPADALTGPSTPRILYEVSACKGEELFKAKQKSSGWSFALDRPLKPGWIAAEGTTGSITWDFRVTERAQVSLGHLLTWGSIGNATCFLDGASGYAEVLDGANNMTKTSWMRDHLFPTILAPGAHNMTCRSDGRKVKIGWLRAYSPSAK